LADRARQPKAVDALVGADVDDRGAVKVKAHQRLQGQFFGAKAIAGTGRENARRQNRSIAGPRGERTFHGL
jgi:hypothetical protein